MVTGTLCHYLHYTAPQMEMKRAPVFFHDSPVARGNGVDDFLVQRPDGVPFKRNDCLRWTLRKHKLREGLDRHTTTPDA